MISVYTRMIEFEQLVEGDAGRSRVLSLNSLDATRDFAGDPSDDERLGACGRDQHNKP